MNIKATNITINVSDLKCSITFYEAIGFKLDKRWGDHYAQLSATGITIGLHPSNPSNMKEGSGNLSIGFIAEDMEAAKANLIKHNIDVFQRNEEGGKFLHFKDPDGTALYFIEPKW